MEDTTGRRLSKKINGDCLFCKCTSLLSRDTPSPYLRLGKSYKFKYQDHDVEVEVNSFICPSFTVFVNGEEANSHVPRRNYWLRLTMW